jgi:predicted permease
VGSLARDVRFALRLLAARPGWTLASVLCLAIATAANTSAFSIVNALILRPLPFEEPDRLVMVALQDADRGGPRPFSLAEYRELAPRAQGFVALVARTFLPVGLSLGDAAQMVEAEFVSGNYFDALKVMPAAGRFFRPEVDRPDAPAEAVISHSLWLRRFGGDPSSVGRIARVNGRPVAIVGVAPIGFVGATRLVAADIWIPAARYALTAGSEDAARVPIFGAMGRLAPRVTGEEARSRLDAAAAAVWPASGAKRPPATIVHPATGFGVPPALRQTVGGGSALIFGLMALLMAVAAANVAALVLARTSGRRLEIGMRLALGARRSRIAAQMLAESALIAIAGAAAGWVLASWVTRVVAATSGTPFDYVVYAVDISPDVRTFVYTAAAALVTTVVVALAPVWHAGRIDLIEVLRKSASGGRATGGSRTLGALVVAQIAASTALLVGCGVLVRAYADAQNIGGGFDTRHLVVGSIDMAQAGATIDHGRRLFDELTTRVAAVPGVSAVGLARSMPVGRSKPTVRISPIDTPSQPSTVGWDVVTAECFRALAVSVVQGRGFAAREPVRPLVAVVNEAMARRLRPEGPPLGARFRIDNPASETLEVIGVVRDAATAGEEPQPVFYRPFSQMYLPQMTVIVRTADDGVPVDAVRRAIQASSADLVVQGLRTLDEQIDVAVAPRRRSAAAVAILSLVGLVLSCLGLYGVVSYGVGQRAREFGIRLALGARAADVRWMVLRQGFRMTAAGVLGGLALSVLVTRVLKTFLPGVAGSEPLLVFAVSLVLAGASLAALYVPARGATRVDPASTLRGE